MKGKLSIGLITLVYVGWLFIIFPEIWVDRVTGSDYQDTRMEHMTVLQLDFEEDEHGGGYLSEPIDAPFPFNAVVPARPHHIFSMVELRTGRDGVWGAWTPLAENHDHSQDQDQQLIGDMIFAPVDDLTHTQVQVRLLSGVLPVLDLTFIDSTGGPNDGELLLRQAELEARHGYVRDETAANPKPTVISRDVWCIDSRCDCPPEGCDDMCLDDDPLEYTDVSHLILHHTVSSNEATNWADKVRAIWSFHAFGRCWGDVGYNYLIDMNGVIYEGHRGGDDVVGTHASAANAGSMGVSLIGTFTLPTENPPGIRPPDPMLNSLIDILAWKADEKEIDVYNTDILPNLGKRPNLMGHRDVYGTTTCPGEQAHDLIPWLREQVDGRLTFEREGYLYFDELSSAFSRSATSWRVGERSCGYNGHAYYTWSTSDPALSTHWGEWEFNVPEDGYYELQANIPYCFTGRGETSSAEYAITHEFGATPVVVDHNDEVGGWTTIGSFSFAMIGPNQLRLTDLTADDGVGVWFDAIRLRRVPPPTPTAMSLTPDEQEITTADVSFQWETEYGHLIDDLSLSVGTDDQMTNRIVEQTLASTALSYTHTFTQDYEALYWQLQVVSTDGVTATSDVAQFELNFMPDPTVTLVSPTTGSWYSDSLVITLTWETMHVVDPSETILQVAADEAMNNLLVDTVLAADQSSHAVTFADSTPWLYWQVTARGREDATSAVGRFGVDVTPPEATVAAVYQFDDGSYSVKVDMIDAHSGISAVDVDFRVVGATEWQSLSRGTAQALVYFRPSTVEPVEFRATAYDIAGNQEAIVDMAEGSTSTAVAMPTIGYLPLINRP